jgi:hypothetical protein
MMAATAVAMTVAKDWTRNSLAAENRIINSAAIAAAAFILNGMPP